MKNAANNFKLGDYQQFGAFFLHFPLCFGSFSAVPLITKAAKAGGLSASQGKTRCRRNTGRL